MNQKQLVGNMREHLDQIIEKINNKEHFGVIRPGDGEYMIMKGITFTAQRGDDWTHNNSIYLKDQLINSFKTKVPNLYTGIPCNSCCIPHMYNQYIETYQVQQNQLTYANVFCNSNWLRFTEFLKSYEKGFYLITTGTRECEFPIKERLYIDKYLVNNWDTVWESETNRILEYIKDKRDELICFASGPMTKIWIPKCMELNPNNIYLDIGSALDFYTKGIENARPYTSPHSQYSKECCRFI
jgi:hypothetical protein